MKGAGWVCLVAACAAAGCSEDSKAPVDIYDASAGGAGTGGDTASGGSTGSGGTPSGSGGAVGTGGMAPAGGTGSGGMAPGSGGAQVDAGGKEPADAGAADAAFAVDASIPTEADSGSTPGYPEGPYGKEVGDIMENYAFRGYVNDAGDVLSNTLPVTDYSLNDARQSGAPFALIHLSAFYCSGCRSAARDLGDLAGDVLDAGGIVIEILFTEVPDGGRGELSAWVETFDLMVTTIVPLDGNTLVESAADREHAFIVDLSTMEIVWTAFGSYTTTTNSSAKQGVAEMLRLLGQ